MICKVKAGVTPPPTTPPPTSPPTQYCHPGEDTTWVMRPGGGEEDCYAFYFSYSDTNSWRQAEKNCSEQGGHLVSVHSIEGNNWIQEEVSLLGYSTGWIGLNRLYT